MSDATKKAIVEGIKLVGRLYVASLIPDFILILQAILAGINVQTYTFNIDWQHIGSMLATLVSYETIIFIIAGLDKFKHILEKETGRLSEGESGGIIPF